MLSNKQQNYSSNPIFDAAVETLITQRNRTGETDRVQQVEARKSLRAFTGYVNPRFKFYKHCEVLIDVLERVVSGEIKRLIIQMPPRHGKSELVSRILAAYYLARRPSHFVCLTSYSYGLAGTLSRAARENYIRAGFDTKADAGAVSHWESLAGGGMFAAGVGGSITGKGFNLGIIDDVTKDAEEANSQIVRDKVWDWYASTFSTRTEPDAAIVVMGTRWHEDDLIGQLLHNERQSTASENWHVVSLPALFEANENFPESCIIEPDFREHEGQALCPERYTAKTLAHKRSQIGGYHFEAMYQQRPTSPSGVMFDVSRIGFVDGYPANLTKRWRGWDKASTEGSGDYTAGVRVSKDNDGIFYVEDVVRGQWDTAKRDRMIRYTAEIDGIQCRVIGEQEPGSGGKDSAGAFIKLLNGFSVRTEKTSGSKELRADPLSAQINAGNFRIVRGDWNADFLEELRQFPRGRHDDQVDALSLAFNRIAIHRTVEFVTFRM